MGYILIVIGVALAVWGIIIIQKPRNKNTEVQQQLQVMPSETKPATQQDKPQVALDSNKAKGAAFEKYVVQHFSRKYFTLQEWRGDKYVDGIYAVSNHFPDLEVVFDFKAKNIKESFAIECKWRQNFYNNGIEWAKDYQLKNYQDYATKLNIPVFVVIGLGGTPDKPQDVFIVPLAKMNSSTITKTELTNYKKENPETAFFWDYEKNVLQ